MAIYKLEFRDFFTNSQNFSSFMFVIKIISKHIFVHMLLPNSLVGMSNLMEASQQFLGDTNPVSNVLDLMHYDPH